MLSCDYASSESVHWRRHIPAVATADIYALGVAPLLAFSQQASHSAVEQSAALAALLPLRACGVAATVRTSAAQQPAVLDSPVARCAADPLCTVLAQLAVCDFLAASRVCRSWRAMRLHAGAWPSGGAAVVFAHLLLSESPAVQLHALRQLTALACAGGSSSIQCMWRAPAATRVYRQYALPAAPPVVSFAFRAAC